MSDDLGASGRHRDGDLDPPRRRSRRESWDSPPPVGESRHRPDPLTDPWGAVEPPTGVRYQGRERRGFGEAGDMPPGRSPMRRDDSGRIAARAGRAPLPDDQPRRVPQQRRPEGFEDDEYRGRVLPRRGEGPDRPRRPADPGDRPRGVADTGDHLRRSGDLGVRPRGLADTGDHLRHSGDIGVRPRGPADTGDDVRRSGALGVRPRGPADTGGDLGVRSRGPADTGDHLRGIADTGDRPRTARAAVPVAGRAVVADPGRRPTTDPLTRPDLRPEQRPEPRSEQRAELRSEQRPEPRPEQRPEPRPEQRPEPRPEQRPEPRSARAPERTSRAARRALADAEPEFVRRVSSPELPDARGYSHATVATGQFVFLAGQLGADVDGRIVDGDLVRQFDRALTNLLTALAAAGGSPEHLASVTVEVISIDEYKANSRQVGRVWRTLLGDLMPALSVSEVRRFWDAEAQVQITGQAVIP